MDDELLIHPHYAKALGLDSLARDDVAARLAELGGLPAPQHDETRELLVRVLRGGLSRIHHTWSWGEVYNSAIDAVFEISRNEDWHQLAVCAVDLGLDDRWPPPGGAGEPTTPRGALWKNLDQAIEGVIRGIREQLEAAGVSPYGPQPRRPPIS